MLLGPVIGTLIAYTFEFRLMFTANLTYSSAPLLGGLVAERFGWRSTFILNATLTFIIGGVSLTFIPETHHYLVTKRYADAKAQEEIDEIRSNVMPSVYSAIVENVDLTERHSIDSNITNKKHPGPVLTQYYPSITPCEINFRKIDQSDLVAGYAINHASTSLSNTDRSFFYKILRRTRSYRHIEVGRGPSTLTPVIINYSNDTNRHSMFDAIALLFEVRHCLPRCTVLSTSMYCFVLYVLFYFLLNRERLGIDF